MTAFGTFVRPLYIALALALASAALGSSANAAPAAVLAATYAATPPPSAMAVATLQIPVTVTNTGDEAWPATAPTPVNLSYHWYRADGSVVIWDGVRTGLGTALAAGATRQLTATVVAPPASGQYLLRFHLVKEGVAWFPQPSQPYAISVAGVFYSAQYAIATTTAAYLSEIKTVPVTVTNTSNVTWNAAGANPINLSYHLFDSAGRTVVWDGLRTPLGTDLAPGATRSLQLQLRAPATQGAYSLNVDAVREGVSWFSGYGVPAASSRLSVSSGFSVGYGATTTPPQASLGASLDITVAVTNYGPRPLSPGGANPVRLSYHIHTAAGAVVVWDGARGLLPRDINPGETVTVPVRVQLPSTVGDYRLSWDLVHEGVAWLSGYGVPMKVEPISVVPGVTFYGKGYGHGVGMSQFGAQGMATGATGTRYTGEQIIQYYYPGTLITPIPTASGNTGMRVLLSVPSSTGIHTCGGKVLNTALVDVKGNGAMRILNEGAGNTLIATAAAGEPWQIHATGGVVRVWRNVGTPTKVYEGPGPVVLVSEANGSVYIQQKGTYRGNTRFTNLSNMLRVINFVDYDKYVMGVIRREMFGGWHHEAYKAQAYAAKAYGYSSYKGGSSDYDVRDDQGDQCYDGVGAETPETNAAVEATRGRIPTYNGQVIRAYFSSSSGGHTLPVGCWGSRATLRNGRYECAASDPYLQGVPDPADLRVSVPDPNKHASWTRAITGAQIRDAVLKLTQRDIGTFQGLELTNIVPAGEGHVVSIHVRGSAASVEVRAEDLLRWQLGLRSTVVRLTPF